MSEVLSSASIILLLNSKFSKSDFQVTSVAANGNSANSKSNPAEEGDKMSSTNGKSANGATNGAGAPQEG